MSSNRDTFDTLLAEQRIDLIRSSIFDELPPNLPADLAWDRVEGALLGIRQAAEPPR